MDGEYFEDYDEYEDDIEDDVYEDDDDDIQLEKNSDIDYEDFENNLENPEDQKELLDDKSNDSESDNEEDIYDNDSDEDIKIDENIKKDILIYKQKNIENFSPLGMISYLCNIVNYIKKGGCMLDSRQDFDYPNETEESYALECVLLDKVPFEYVVNKKKVNINFESKIICLKIVLRCVDENKSIFFTPTFTKKFPIFTKSLMNNYISQEEINEIVNLKKIAEN